MKETLTDVWGWFWPRFRGVFVRNVHLKAIALLLTFALYLWVGKDRESQIVAPAPLQVSVPDDHILVRPDADSVKLTVRGRWSRLNQLDRRELGPIKLELTEADDGKKVPISPRTIDLPPGLRAVSVQPSLVQVELAERLQTELQVRARIVGHPPGSHQVGDVRVTPSKIEVSGPREVLSDRTFIVTDPIDVSGRTRSFETDVSLRPESPLVELALDGPVRVGIDIEAPEVRRTVRDVPVHPVETSYRAETQPETLDVTIEGPPSIIEEFDRSALHATIDLSEEDEREPGTFEKRAELKNLPADVEAVQIHPRSFLVTTEPPRAPPDGENSPPPSPPADD